MKSCRRTVRGAAMVEFLFVAALLVFLLFGVMEMGFMLSNSLTLQNAAADGARAASLGQKKNQVDEAVYLAAESLRDSQGNINIDITTESREPGGAWTPWNPGRPPAGGSNDQVRVTVTYEYHYLTGSLLGRLMPGGEGTPSTRTITKSSVMRYGLGS